MKELTAILAHQVHLGFATARTRIAVLQFVVLGRTHNLDQSGFFEPGKVPVNGAQRDFGQALGYFRRLENPVRIAYHKVQNLLF